MPARLFLSFRGSNNLNARPAAVLLTGVSAVALLAVLSTAHAGGVNILSGKGGGGAAPAAAASQAAAQQGAAAAQQAAQQSVNALTKASQAIQAMRAAQSAARNLAIQAPTNVTNGLSPGGLVVDPRVGTDPSLWVNASKPTQQVTNGQVTVTIEQQAQKALLTWQQFNVGRETTVRFDQSKGNAASGNNWVALNRINASGAPSQILGQIKAEGTVLLINPNGIIFNGSSQVNVGSLIASSASIDPAAFMSTGIYSTQSGSTYLPSFTNAGGKISVEAGAEITTAAPKSVTSGGGYVMLMGTEVQNSGSISTPKGQALLSAGDSFILRSGYSTASNQFSTTRGTEIAPVINVGSASGKVTNAGLIFAQQGDITLAGHDVTQGGILVSTTSVNQRGTIHLLNAMNDASGSVTLTGDAITAILPELDSKDTALDSQRDALIAASAAQNLLRAQATLGQFNNLSTLADRLDQSRVEIVTGGNAVFEGGSYTAAQGGQIAVQAGKRIFTETGATLDVSGVRNVALAMGSNNISINVQGNELRDSPQNRDSGYLANENVWIDVRNLTLVPAGTGGYASDRYYTPGGLLEVGGYLGNTAHTIGEWTAVGGTVTLSAPEVVAQKGSIFNLSGGSVAYQGGYIRTTNFLGADGRLYNIGDNAPADMKYYGVGDGFIRDHEHWGQIEVWMNPFGLNRDSYRWEDGYTVGRDAGRLILSTPTSVFEGDILASVIQGERQIAARPTGISDGYKATQNIAALAGTLALGQYTTFGLANAYQTDVRIGDVAAITGSMNASTALSPDRANTAYLDTGLLNDAHLGGLVIATRESISVDAPLHLSNGGKATLIAPIVDVNASITAHSGSVTITNILQPDIPASSPAFLTPPGGRTQLTLGAGATIDTSGLWSNGILDSNNLSGLAYLDGGDVTFKSSYGVALSSGSAIDVSSGAAIMPNGKTRGGKGGDVTLFAHDETNVSGAGGALVVDGDIRGYGVNGGGTLAIDAASVVIGARGTSHAATDLLLTPDLVRKGFSKYDINGHEKLTVAAGAMIDVTMPVYRFGNASFAVPTGANPAGALDVWTPPQYLEDPVNGKLIQRGGADLVLESNNLLHDGQIAIGKDTTLTVDPGRSITVQSPGQITIEGTLRASGGAIDVIQMNLASEKGAPANPAPGQRSIWIGDHAVLDVAAWAVTAIDSNGLRYGVVPDGGAITIGAPTKRENGDGVAQAAEAFIVVRPGALLDASGASAVIDIPMGSALSRASTPVTVASDGGTIALNSFNGLYLDGTMRAAAGGAGASGGALLLTLETARYKAFAGDPPIPDDVRYIRELVIGQNYQASGSDGPLKVGTGRFSVDQIKAGGFDTLSAYADIIRFDGNVDLSLGRDIELYHSALVTDASAVSVRLAAPHIQFREAPGRSLEGNPVYPKAQGNLSAITPSQRASRAALIVDADLVDIFALQLGGAKGAVQLQSGSRSFDYAGFDHVTVNSRGDIRLAGNLIGSRLLDLNAAQIYPVTGATATIMAKDLVRFGRIGGDTPDLPYSVFGKLNVYGKAIEQGGVLRAPLGKITLGSATTVGTLAPPITETVALLPGSITSVSGNGLVLPYGGTVDDVTYLYNGVKVTAPIEAYGDVSTGVVLAGKSFNVAQGALIDLSGGGDVRGAGFVSGRGGSVDVLATALANANPGYGYSSKGNQVYAIVPGVQRYAPIDAGAGAAPGIGRTITIPEGVPGLKAGTYTLMPARYALMPGAYRVEIGGTTTYPYGAVAAGNGSWLVSGYQGVANTRVKDTLPTQMIVTPGDTVRTYSQYNETGYAGFLVTDAARLNAPRPILPIDGKTLYLNYPVQPSTAAPALVFDGKALFTPAKGGYGGILRVDGNNFGKINLEIVANGAPHTPGLISIEADALNAIGAVRMSLGSFQNFIRDLNYISTGSFTTSLVVREGVVLQAPEVILGANQGGVSIEDGVKISTLGRGGATPFSAADGYSYNLYDSSTNILAVSNGSLDFLSLGGASGGSNAGINIGKAELYTEGTLLFATGSGGKLALDRDVSYGAKYLSLVVPSINIGENAAIDAALAAGVLPDGLVLNQQVLASLLQGNRDLGVPKVETLLLSAGQSINFFGSVNLDTIDPATGKSSLAELVLNTPAIYGLGDADAHAKITTGTLIWNGVGDGKPRNATTAPGSLPPPAVVANGPGTGHGTFDVIADEIVFGYRKFTNPDTQLTLDRLALGFSTVNLTASQRITANNRNSLAVYHTGTDAASYAGGDLNLITPLLTGEGASINRITAGGALTLSAPAGSVAARTNVTGAEIGLKGQTVTVASTIALPSGKLTVEADNALTLTGDARIDMAGRAITMIDVVKYSWGGDVILSSNHGDVTQAAGSVIDLSARNNNAGTLAVTAVDAGGGAVDLLGTILGSSTGQQALGGTVMPYDNATIDVRAQTIADFAGLNRRLTRDEVFGGRSFQIKKEGFDLVVGDELKANGISVSVDGGGLTVNGKVDASGLAVGTIRLGARDGLTLASTAVLDAHGTRLRVDSYGQPIDAPNRAVVELTSSQGMLTLASGATIDVHSADAVARGTVTLNAPRLSETGGDIAIDARGPLNIAGAKSIAVNGFWRYTDAPAGTPDADGTPTQIINQAYVDAIHGKSTTFISNALDNAGLQDRLGGLKAYGAAYHLRPGVEIASATKDGNLTVEGDLDLSGYRYGLAVNPAIRGSGEPGMLVLRAGGDLNIKGSINDGFGVPPVTGAGVGRDVTGLLTEDYTTTAVVVLQGSMFGGTTFPTDTGLTLNFDAPMARPAVKAGITIPFEFVGNESFAYYLPDYSGFKPWATTAPIWGPDGSLLYAAGAVVRDEIPFRSRYGAGIVLPYDPFGQYMLSTFGTVIVPRGTPLDIFDETYGPLSLAENITLPVGAIVPKGTNVVGVIGSIAPPPDHPTWSIAPMLAAGSQSWSMRLASGADVTAADSRVLRPAKAGNLVLDDLHLVGPAKDQPNISVIRTGTGDLDLLAGGNFEMKSLFGIYTAGTQSADIGANGSDPFNQPRGFEQLTNPAGGTTVLGPAGTGYESLVSGPSSIYRAWYPEQGGNLLVAAQGDVTGYTTAAVNDPGRWLWRQGGDISGQPTAWWINFGTYTYGGTLVGFGGLGTFGGGNVIVTAGGDAGQLLGLGSSGNPISQGLNIAVGSTGRVIDGRLVQTGGGDLTLKVGGALNPLQPSFNSSSNLQNDEGVIANLRGAVDVSAGAIGRIDLTYGWSRPQQFNADPRPVDPRSPNFGASAGGPVLYVGDAAAALTSRGDLVLTKADDPGRASQSNTTPYKLTQNGVTTSYGGGGTTWFSLWTDNTAIDLFAAGGNLTPFVPAGQTVGASTDYPATLRAVAAEGSIYYGVLRDNNNPVAVSLTLAPSPIGQLEMLARDSIYTLGMPISMSGADPAALPTPFRPAFIGYTGGTAKANNLNPAGEGVSPSSLYAFGPNTVTGNLHAGDSEPQRFYAVNGDIVGLRTGEILDFTNSGTVASSKLVNTWYVAAKPVRIIAGRDIVGSGEQPYAFDANGKPFYPTGHYNSSSLGNILYHPDADDVSVVSAGRDILYANFQVAGPGALEVSAGRNIYQADKGSITSIGPVASGDNRPGASIFMQAGVGASGPDYAKLASLYLDPMKLADPKIPLADQPDKVAKTYEKELAAWLKERDGFVGTVEEARARFAALAPEQQRIFLLQVYFAELREGGREYNNPNSSRYGSYLRGRDVIATLFPRTDYSGDITMFGGSNVRTLFGGDISMLTPGGKTVIGVEGLVPPSTAGVVTQGQGNIQMYSKGSILLGLSRVMTTFGGNILAWSAEGDINAGRGAKTTVVYTPPKLVYDAYGHATLSPAAPSSGAGIATLNPIPEVPAGDIDLIAPLGTIDAGEAGIRFSGNVYLAALQVINAANISGQGTVTGVPVVQPPNVTGLTQATNTASASTKETAPVGNQAPTEQPSIIIVEVVGYGGGDDDSAPSQSDKRWNDKKQQSRYNPDSSIRYVGVGTLTDDQKRMLTSDEQHALSRE